MQDFLLSIFLGIVEGLTEFLPVSSTAHLRIVEALLHIDLHDGFWKMYTIVIQLGAILALPVSSHVSKGRTRRSHHLDEPVKSYFDRVCRYRASGLGFDETDRQKPGKSLGDGLGAPHRWHNHVGSGCDLYPPASCAYGRDEPAASGVDRRGANSLCNLSRNFPIDVHNRGRTSCGHVAPSRARIFIFFIDADDADGDRV